MNIQDLLFGVPHFDKASTSRGSPPAKAKGCKGDHKFSI